VILRSQACLVRARKDAHEGNPTIARIIEAVSMAL
jgi:ATP phosphoribosyltransferase